MGFSISLFEGVERHDEAVGEELVCMKYGQRLRAWHTEEEILVVNVPFHRAMAFGVHFYFYEVTHNLIIIISWNEL